MYIYTSPANYCGWVSRDFQLWFSPGMLFTILLASEAQLTYRKTEGIAKFAIPQIKLCPAVDSIAAPLKQIMLCTLLLSGLEPQGLLKRRSCGMPACKPARYKPPLYRLSATPQVPESQRPKIVDNIVTVLSMCFCNK